MGKNVDYVVWVEKTCSLWMTLFPGKKILNYWKIEKPYWVWVHQIAALHVDYRFNVVHFQVLDTVTTLQWCTITWNSELKETFLPYVTFSKIFYHNSRNETKACMTGCRKRGDYNLPSFLPCPASQSSKIWTNSLSFLPPQPCTISSTIPSLWRILPSESEPE